MKKRLILLVCGGDTSRSPMAKVILQQMLIETKLDDKYEVDSAGIKPDGKAANQVARNVIINMYDRDLLANHAPKQLTSELVDRAYIVMAMETIHAAIVPTNKLKVLGISDPHGKGYESYHSCSRELKSKFKKLWPIITSGRSAIEELPHRISDSAIVEMAKSIAAEVDYGRGRGLQHAEAVTVTSLAIFDGLLESDIVFPKFVHQRYLLEAVCYLHDVGVGQEEDDEEHNEAGFRWFVEKISERYRRGVECFPNSVSWILAYCILWHRGTNYGLGKELEIAINVKSLEAKYPPDILEKEHYATLFVAKYLAAILRIGDALSFPSGRPVKKVAVIYTDDILKIEACPAKKNDSLNLQCQQADKKKDLFVSATKILGLKNIEDVHIRRCSHPSC